MKIWKRIRPDHIFLNVSMRDKDMVIRFVADVFYRAGIIQDAGGFYNALMLREKTMSTGVGDGIGIPHAASPEAQDVGVLLMRLAEPIDFDALDDLPVDIILAMVLPENQTTLHLQILAAASRIFQNPEFFSAVRQAVEPNELFEEIKRLEGQISFH